MGGCDDGVNVAADGEVAGDRDFVWIQKVDQVLNDDVGDVFVKDLLIAEAIDVKLQRFEFNAVCVGNVLDANRGEVRKAAAWAQAREFGAGELDRVTADCRTVLETLEFVFFDSDFAVQFAVLVLRCFLRRILRHGISF